MPMSAQGIAAPPMSSTTCQSGAGIQGAMGRHAEPARMPMMIGCVARRRRMARAEASRPSARSGREGHGDGKMHGDEEKERHRALVAIGLEDHRDADEHRVRLAGGEAGDHRRGAGEPEEALPDDHRKRPHDGHAGEIGDPVAPGLHGGDLGSNEGAEDQAGHREREDELGEALAGAVGEETGPACAIANADQAEDRQDDRERCEHLTSVAGSGKGMHRAGQIHS